MNKLGITEGEISQIPSLGLVQIITPCGILAAEIEVKYAEEEWEANTTVIAEAFTVANATGLSPLQLKDEMEFYKKQLADFLKMDAENLPKVALLRQEYDKLKEQRDELLAALKSSVNLGLATYGEAFKEWVEYKTWSDLINNCENTLK